MEEDKLPETPSDKVLTSAARYRERTRKVIICKAFNDYTWNSHKPCNIEKGENR